MAKESLEEEITESKASSRLGKHLDDMIEEIHEGLDELEEDTVKEVTHDLDADKYVHFHSFPHSFDLIASFGPTERTLVLVPLSKIQKILF